MYISSVCFALYRNFALLAGLPLCTSIWFKLWLEYNNKHKAILSMRIIVNAFEYKNTLDYVGVNIDKLFIL